MQTRRLEPACRRTDARTPGSFRVSGRVDGAEEQGRAGGHTRASEVPRSLLSSGCGPGGRTAGRTRGGFTRPFPGPRRPVAARYRPSDPLSRTLTFRIHALVLRRRNCFAGFKTSRSSVWSPLSPLPGQRLSGRSSRLPSLRPVNFIRFPLASVNGPFKS